MFRLAFKAFRPLASKAFIPNIRYFNTTTPPPPPPSPPPSPPPPPGPAPDSHISPPSFTKVNSKVLNFQTETNKLLDIVAKSLYMDKEVFIRELVSNASDALEKQRYLNISGQSADDTPLTIKITVDAAKGTISFRDSGIGMTADELIKNLGTIAYSGSHKFIESLKANEENKSSTEKIIGQFGVGFYSSFIVGNEVRVISKSENCQNPHLWVSKGLGEFEISELEGLDFPRGTEVTVELKEDCKQFLNEADIKKTLTKYSNFVNFPLELNSQQINLQGALWARNKNDVEENEYQDFYEYISGQKLPYKWKLHFSLEIPLSMKVLLYVPNTHKEKYGMANESCEVGLYSRKVLIMANCSQLLPNWLRFVKGIVDCEDIQLNVSRETFQDSAMMEKIKGILTKKLLKFLSDEAERDESGFMRWYQEFGQFLIEGMAMDQENSKAIMTMTRYYYSLNTSMTTLDKYIEKMKPGQQKIYYLFTANREIGMDSPYLEPFKTKEIPVIFSLQLIDEMIFKNMGEYKGHKFVNIESSIDEIEKDLIETHQYNEASGIPEADLVPFVEWIKNETMPIVDKVIVSSRLKDSPAVVTGEMPSAVRQVYKLMDREKHTSAMTRNQTFEINTNHEIIIKLNEVRKTDPELAKDIISQVLDNALLNAGIMESPVNMIKRLNRVMLRTLRDAKQ
ncbi:unnamed protein product [Blepharisma stoltei]|uniref:Uncharacterized protein n=1 Tax=Blepharisma stoltei TaxID=1481888 RepID=A0AAU9JPD6_9CILI|nr:unnamed protein product [Blepharisma stoltei]